MEEEERLAAARKRDRDEARDAAAAAAAYLQTLRDPIITLKDLYRTKYGDRCLRHMVRGDYAAAKESSEVDYAGVAGRNRAESAENTWEDDARAAAVDEEPKFAFVREAPPEEAAAVVEEDDGADAQSWGYLDDDVLQRFLDGDDGAMAGGAAHKGDDETASVATRDSDSDSDDGNEDEAALAEVEAQHADALQRWLARRRSDAFAPVYAEPSREPPPPHFDRRGRAHFGIDVDEWRRRLESLKAAVDEEDVALYLPQAPELEYAHYMTKRGRFTEASGTLRRLLSKQKSDFRRLRREADRPTALAGDGAARARRPRAREKDALAILSSRTERVLADLEEARARPHVALALRKRSLATHLRVIGPGDGTVTMENRDLEKALATTARLYGDLGAADAGVALYNDLHRRYVRSNLESRRLFAARMAAKAHELRPSPLFNVQNRRRGDEARVDATTARGGRDRGEWLYRDLKPDVTENHDSAGAIDDARARLRVFKEQQKRDDEEDGDFG